MQCQPLVVLASKCFQTEILEGGRIKRCSQRMQCEDCLVGVSGGGFTIDDDVDVAQQEEAELDLQPTVRLHQAIYRFSKQGIFVINGLRHSQKPQLLGYSVPGRDTDTSAHEAANIRDPGLLISWNSLHAYHTVR